MEHHGKSTMPFLMSTDMAFSSPALQAVEKTALKRSFRHEQNHNSDRVLEEEEICWVFGEKGNLFDEDSFSIDELLDLENFSDDRNEEEATENISVTPLETAYEAIDSNSPTPLLAGFSLPTHDAADLEWVSNIIDDSLSDFPAISQPVDMTIMKSQMVCTLSTEAQVPSRSKRTKRSHTPTSWSSSSTSSSSTNSEESCLLYEPQNPEKHKAPKRGRKAGHGSAPAAKERRCSHCGVNKTPQWRTGPQGAKTLCNACGVRFKSGRLLPEYRPACSPTFEVNLHSNSHRKVLEMRKKREAELGEVATAY